MTERERLISLNLINPHPIPPTDTRPCFATDDWGLHEAAREIAWAHPNLRTPLEHLVRLYR